MLLNSVDNIYDACSILLYFVISCSVVCTVLNMNKFARDSIRMFY